MMGRLPEEQAELFYEFCLDTYIPEDHLLRGIDRFLDVNGLHQHLEPYYSAMGRPSVDPELMIRMLIIGYCYGIRSERRLCEEAHFNLAYRWFCRLGLEGEVPDHSTFSKNRHGRFRDSEAFRFVFESVVRQCMSEGLVRGEGFAIDASVVRADANRQRGVSGDTLIDWGDPDTQNRPVREYLQALDADTVVPPKNVSLTDPASRWTAAPGGPAFYAYSTNYLVDVEAGIIVDVEPTAAYRPEEVNATKTMIDRVEARFELKPQRLIGDTAYGTAEILGWMVDEKAIEPHVPLWEKGERNDGTFSRSDFNFDPISDTYTCPGGKPLKRYRRSFKQHRTGVTKANTINYRASQFDCKACAMKARCCPNTCSRKVTRSVHEAARDVVRRINTTPAYRQSRRDRKKVEMLFAHMKRILKLDRLRLCGLRGARDEFLLTATVQNLRRMVKLCTHPPPNGRISVPV